MTNGHLFDPTILREYDVRGVVGENLHTADATALGRAFGTIARRLGKTRLCVGYDGRVSSPELEQALVDGLRQAGISVLRIGRGPTPMLYFSTYHCEAGGGVMVTGSHNPPTHNGFKMVLDGKSFFGSQITGLGELAASGDFVSDGSTGDVTDVRVTDAYVDRLLQDLDEEAFADLAVGWDPGNGSAGEVTRAVVDRLSGRHVLINEEIDGSFPNHHPDPTVAENLVQLQDLVAREKLDLGIAFDGDGDRIGAVDGSGRIIWGDQLLAIFSRNVLAAHPGATIIADVKASQVLFDEVAALGGQPLMWQTGHSLIKTKMAETGAPLAGEMSGHIFFADKYYGYDDAVYGGLRLLEAVAGNGGGSLTRLRDALPTMLNTPELRFSCPEDRKFVVPQEVLGRLRDSGADFSAIDGVRVSTNDGWWLLRASNTQDVLVARCESGSEEGLDRLKSALIGQLAQSGIEAPDFS